MGVENPTKGLNTKGIITNKMEICDNIKDTVIRITETKARLIYRDYLRHSSGGQVATLFGLFLTFVTTLVTADFKDVAGLENSNALLQALYILLAGVTGVKTIASFFKWTKEAKSKNEDTFINALKGYENKNVNT